MSAPTGNKYAEKWTYEKTISALCALERSSHDDQYLYLGQALCDAGLYNDIWRYWRRKWSKRYEIIHTMKMIMQRFEVRLFNKMAKKELPERVAMFALKHHYGWGKEEKEDNTTSYDYVDMVLIDENGQTVEALPQPEPIAAPEPQKSRPQTSGFKIPGTQLHDADFKRKLSEYNKANPHKPLSRPATYFTGPGPVGIPYILYDGGYFLTVKLEDLR